MKKMDRPTNERLGKMVERIGIEPFKAAVVA